MLSEISQAKKDTYYDTTCPLQWQTDPLTLDHQGCPVLFY